VSPPPPPPIDGSGIPPEVKDGVIASVLGGLAMTARILLSTEPVSFGFVVRRFFAASITAMLVGLGTKDHFSSTGLWLAVSGGSGYAAPEVTDYLLRYVKAKGEAKLAEVKGSKGNGKNKTKKAKTKARR
jgi:hypothetical protein